MSDLNKDGLKPGQVVSWDEMIKAEKARKESKPKKEVKRRVKQDSKED